MQQQTTVTIDGAKTSLAFGARFTLELANGKRIEDVELDRRVANGDLVFAAPGLPAGEIRIRPAKIASIFGSGVEIGLDEPAPPSAEEIRAAAAMSGWDPDDLDATSRSYDPTIGAAFEISRTLATALEETPEGPGYAKRLAETLRQNEPELFADHTTPTSWRATASGDGYVCTTKVRLETGFIVDCGRVVEQRRGVWQHYVETRSLAPARKWKRGETATAFIARLERELSGPEYVAFIGSEAGQEALRAAGVESLESRKTKPSKSAGSVPIPAGADREPAKPRIRSARTSESVPDGSKRCPGVPKRDVAPHIAEISAFGKHSGKPDGLSSTCRSCHRLFVEIAKAKRQEAKAAPKEGAK